MGTKRMWLRRFFRIGDTISLILSTMWKGVRWYWETIGVFGTFIICFVTAALFGLGMVIYHGNHDDKYADNVSIEQARAQDWCMKLNVPLWPGKLRGADAGPVTYGDLYNVRAACDRRIAQDAAQEAQAKALK